MQKKSLLVHELYLELTAELSYTKSIKTIFKLSVVSLYTWYASLLMKCFFTLRYITLIHFDNISLEF